MRFEENVRRNERTVSCNDDDDDDDAVALCVIDDWNIGHRRWSKRCNPLEVAALKKIMQA